MLRRDETEDGESPFLLEALEPFRESPETEGLVRHVATASRRLSRGARRHLRRALVRHLAETGASESEALEAIEAESPFLGEGADETDELRLEHDVPAHNQPAGSRDLTVAVPAFSAPERGRVGLPLLQAKDNDNAAKTNASTHPDRSGVSAEDMRAALRDYVDLDAVGKAIADHNRTTRDTMIAPGRAPFDAILVEAIHQFQTKCYLAPNQADGIAGESTLDSLGLIRHRLSGQDPTNATAKGILLSQARAVKEATGGEFTAEGWFQDFVNPSWLGHRFKVAVHPTLVRALRTAENHLLSQKAYAGFTPVALGRALGFTAKKEPHAGGRPRPTGGVSRSFHLFGLAIDVRYLSNPWIAGNPDQTKHGNKQFIAVMERATLLLSGHAIPVDSAFLAALAPRATREICQVLRDLSDTLRGYLALARNPVDLRSKSKVEGGQTVKRVVKPEHKDVDDAFRWWRDRVAADVESLRDKGNFKGRDARNGFFDLPPDLVVALRDKAGLAWGAVDIGASQSGDVMHFDLRKAEIGKAVRPPAPRTGMEAKPRQPEAGGAGRPKTAPPPLRAHVAPPGLTLYTSIAVQAPGVKSPVGIFVPEKFRPKEEVDIVFYFHGLLDPCNSPGPNIDRYWDTGLARPGQHHGTGPMALREELNASRKNVILVAPSLGSGSHAGAVIARGGFDALVRQVLATLRDRGGLAVGPRSVRHIVLSGHSKGGSHMRGIVTPGDATAARVKEMWGFDSFYGSADPETWKNWAQADQQRRRVYHYYRQGYKRKEKGQKQAAKLTPWHHTDILARLADDAGLRNLFLVKAAGENHCSIPMKFFRTRLEASGYLDNV